MQFGDKTHDQILLRDNINASVGAAIVEPEQVDFSNIRGAVIMGDKQKGEIELISQSQRHMITPAKSENYAKQAPGNSVVGEISMSDLEDVQLDPKGINLEEANRDAYASVANIALIDSEKGAKSAREDQQT